MTKHSYKHCLLTFSCRVMTKGHKNLNKLVDLLKYARPFVTTGMKGLNSHKINFMIFTH